MTSCDGVTCRSFSFLNRKDRASVITIARNSSIAGSPPRERPTPSKLSFDQTEDLMERGARSEAEVDTYSNQDVSLPLLVHAHNFNWDSESEVEVPLEEIDDGVAK